MTRVSRRHPGQSHVVLRAIGALAALAALVVGVPLVLIRLAGALPIDLTALSPGAWSSAADGRLLLMAVLAVCWVAWAVMVLSVLLEVASALRMTATPVLPGLAGPQRLASALVAALLVALSTSLTAGAPAADAAALSASGPAVTSWAHPVGQEPSAARPLESLVTSTSVGLRGRPQDPAEPADARHVPASTAGRSEPAMARPSDHSGGPAITTRRHDTLWMLAEAHLGSGERYVEIVALNHGVPQPDGRSLGDDGRLYPGWTLVLPADAVMDAEGTEHHRVVRGDTLWGIADEEWGDPTRYPEIARANLGDLQPDGRRLADPDLILPGWVLEIPGSAQDPIGNGAAGPTQDLPSQGEGRAADLDGLGPIDRAGRSPDADEPIGESESGGEPEPVADPTVAEGPGGHGTGETPAETPSSEEPEGVDESAPLPLLDRASLRADAVPRPDASPEGVDSVAADIAPAAVDPDSALTSLPRGGILGTVILAGIGVELVRRRRQFQRFRRPGEQLRMPVADAGQVEGASRSALRDPAPDLLDHALTQLALGAAEAGRPIPDIRLVRLGSGSVTLDLAARSLPALAPFRSTDGLRWVAEASELSTVPADHPRALPGLVTLGASGSETLLLNLECVGTLSVAGADQALADVLRGLAAELAFGACSAMTERTLCVADSTIAAAVEAGSIAVDTDLSRVSATLAAAMSHADAVPSDPVTGDPAASDPLQLVLSDQPLSTVVVPNSGCGLITTAGQVDWSGASLVVECSGEAVLLPERERLIPQALSRPATDDLVDVLRSADLPNLDEASEVPFSATPSRNQGHEVIDLRCTSERIVGEPPGVSPSPATAVVPVPDVASPTAAQLGAPQAADAANEPSQHGGVQLVQAERCDTTVPRILLLGEVRVENAYGKAESTRIGRLAQTAAFVLLHPGARPSELQGALWPGRRSNPQTCRQMISRTRTWLGRTPAGEPYLMPFAATEGRLRMRPEVISDWTDFQSLAEIGLLDPQDTEHLVAALALVRGRPFGAVAARELPWADLHINEMICSITDVSHALAIRLELAEDRSGAHEAALRGLRTECESEALEEIVARTAPRRSLS